MAIFLYSSWGAALLDRYIKALLFSVPSLAVKKVRLPSYVAQNDIEKLGVTQVFNGFGYSSYDFTLCTVILGWRGPNQTLTINIFITIWFTLIGKVSVNGCVSLNDSPLMV